MRISFLVCVFVLLLCAQQSFQRRGGGFRIRSYRRGSRGGSLSSSKSRKSTIAKGIAAGMLLYPAAKILTHKRIYGHRIFPDHEDDFIYYEADELPVRFHVNHNAHNTEFLLVLEEEKVYNCLIVSKSTTKSLCPKAFKDHVTNTTRFLLPREFETPDMDLDESYSPPKTIPKDNIALCCGSSGILPNIIFLVVLLMLSLFCYQT